MELRDVLERITSVGRFGRTPGLYRMTELMRRLGNPQDEMKLIHVAGSNGKGSVTAMLTAVLEAAGYRTGRFISPHLRRYNERISVNGQDISDQDLCLLGERVLSAAEGLSEYPTEFELWTALGLCYFQQCNCELVVLEVGLGGRLDATNVIPAPEVAVITNLALEHTEHLGHTLAEIAAEKSGIIKPGSDVVLYSQSQEAEEIVRERCRVCGCTLRVTDKNQQTLQSSGLTGQTFQYRQRESVRLRLPGMYQYHNAAVVLDVLDMLQTRGYSISEQAIARGLECVVWPGRFEVLQRDPLVIVDGAHNPNAVEELTQCLRTCLPNQRMTFVMGVMADKDYMAMLDYILPLAKQIIAVKPEGERSLSSRELKRALEARSSLPVLEGGSVEEGLTLALNRVSPQETVVVFGSLYQVGEVRDYFLTH